VLPEVGDAESAVSAFECFLEALHIVEIRCHHFRARICQGLCLLRVHVSGDRAGRKGTVLIIEDRPDKAATLRASGANYCDDPLARRSAGFFISGFLGSAWCLPGCHLELPSWLVSRHRLPACW